MPVAEWFFQWLVFHQSLHPHRQWVKSDDYTAPDFYEGWINVFEKIGVTQDLAQQASRVLQENPPRFLNDHLRELKTIILDLAKREREQNSHFARTGRDDPGLAEACLQSKACPECGGDGWARRYVYHEKRRWMPMMSLFCRCPAGRWRCEHNDDMDGGLPNFDDLQAHPELWNPDLASRLWSRHPLPPIKRPSASYRYMLPGEPRPTGV